MWGSLCGSLYGHFFTSPPFIVRNQVCKSSLQSFIRFRDHLKFRNHDLHEQFRNILISCFFGYVSQNLYFLFIFAVPDVLSSNPALSFCFFLPFSYFSWSIFSSALDLDWRFPTSAVDLSILISSRHNSIITFLYSFFFIFMINIFFLAQILVLHRYIKKKINKRHWLNDCSMQNFISLGFVKMAKKSRTTW